MIPTAIDTAAAVDWYRRNRVRSAAIFDLIEPAAYYSRPISLRNPIVFYEGHLPAFSVLAFVRRGLGRPGVDARLEKLFERGIDPESEASAVPRSGAAHAEVGPPPLDSPRPQTLLLERVERRRPICPMAETHPDRKRHPAPRDICQVHNAVERHDSPTRPAPEPITNLSGDMIVDTSDDVSEAASCR